MAMSPDLWMPSFSSSSKSSSSISNDIPSGTEGFHPSRGLTPSL